MRSTWTRLIAVAALAALVCAPLGVGAQNSPFPLTQTATLQNAAVATGNGTSFNVSQFAAITVQTVISATATVTFESSNDGTNFVSQTCYSLDGQTSSTSASSSGVVRCQVNGLLVFRARISSFGSGTVTVTANGTSNALAVRDQIALSGAITGQLRGTQTTAPTLNTSISGSGAIGTVAGTDSFMKGLIGNPPNWSQNAVVTFNVAYAAAPACTAAWDGTMSYGYYVAAITTTTTTATIKLGGVHGPIVNAGWSPGDVFSMICAGTQ